MMQPDCPWLGFWTRSCQFHLLNTYHRCLMKTCNLGNPCLSSSPCEVCALTHSHSQSLLLLEHLHLCSRLLFCSSFLTNCCIDVFMDHLQWFLETEDYQNFLRNRDYDLLAFRTLHFADLENPSSNTFFHDSYCSYCRRSSFSPRGHLIATPSSPDVHVPHVHVPKCFLTLLLSLLNRRNHSHLSLHYAIVQFQFFNQFLSSFPIFCWSILLFDSLRIRRWTFSSVMSQ